MCNIQFMPWLAVAMLLAVASTAHAASLRGGHRELWGRGWRATWASPTPAPTARAALPSCPSGWVPTFGAASLNGECLNTRPEIHRGERQLYVRAWSWATWRWTRSSPKTIEACAKACADAGASCAAFDFKRRCYANAACASQDVGDGYVSCKQDPDTCDAATVNSVAQHGRSAGDVELCHETIVRTQSKIDKVHKVTDVLADVHRAAKNVKKVVRLLDKVWSKAKPMVKAIPKVGKLIEVAVTPTLKTAGQVTKAVTSVTKVFPTVNKQVAKAATAAEKAAEGSYKWTKAAATVQDALETARDCGAACASGLVRATAAAANTFYTGAVRNGLDVCTGELKDFNDKVDKFYDNLKNLMNFADALKAFADFIDSLVKKIEKFIDSAMVVVDQAMCCSGLNALGQVVGSFVDVATCPIDGSIAVLAEAANEAIIAAMRPLLKSLVDSVNFPAFPGISLSAELVLYDTLPAAARGCGLPDRLALSAKASIPRLDLNAELRGALDGLKKKKGDDKMDTILDTLNKMMPPGKHLEMSDADREMMRVAAVAADAFLGECANAIGNFLQIEQCKCDPVGTAKAMADNFMKSSMLGGRFGGSNKKAPKIPTSFGGFLDSIFG